MILRHKAGQYAVAAIWVLLQIAFYFVFKEPISTGMNWVVVVVLLLLVLFCASVFFKDSNYSGKDLCAIWCGLVAIVVGFGSSFGTSIWLQTVGFIIAQIFLGVASLIADEALEAAPNSKS